MKAPTAKIIGATVCTITLSFGLAACSDNNSNSSNTSTTADAQPRNITVENCGEQVSFDHVPERVVLMKSAPIPTLAGLGVMDKVVARAGAYPKEYYSDELYSKIEAIPSITDKLEPSGHVEVSREEIVSQNPDLVLGSTDTITGPTMQAVGIPMIENPAFCDALEGDASFDDVWSHINTMGTIFDKEDEAKKLNDQLKSRLDKLEPAGKKADGTPLRVAVLYPTLGTGTTYAYGTTSMSNPVIEATGAENVYADEKERVFDASNEDLVDRNPDVVIALYTDGDAKAVVDDVAALPGFNKTTAGKEGNIMAMGLNYAEPPTPLAVDGAEKVNDYLRKVAQKRD